MMKAALFGGEQRESRTPTALTRAIVGGQESGKALETVQRDRMALARGTAV